MHTKTTGSGQPQTGSVASWQDMGMLSYLCDECTRCQSTAVLFLADVSGFRQSTAMQPDLPHVSLLATRPQRGVGGAGTGTRGVGPEPPTQQVIIDGWGVKKKPKKRTGDKKTPQGTYLVPARVGVEVGWDQ